MKVGWLGIGNMGLPMVEKLIDGGHQVTVFDLRSNAMEALHPRKFESATHPRNLGDICEIVFFSLPSLEATRTAVLGPDGLLTGCNLKLLVNTCTIGTALVTEIEEAARARRVELVDCPISGGPEAARKAALSVMVSGTPEAVERVRPLISLFGPTITVAGDRAGAAQMLKLVNNLIILTAYAGTLEAFVLGAKAGLDPDVMLNAINAGTLAPNGTTKSWLPNYILKGVPVGAKLEMMVKDMDAALEEGRRFGVPMWVCETTGCLARQATFMGLGEKDVTAFVNMIEAGALFELPRKSV